MRRLDNETVQGLGFKIAVPDIHTVVYSEECRRAQVEMEGGMSEGKVDWLVYATTLSAWESNDGPQTMTKEERNTVLKRISAALTVLDMPNRIAW